MGSKARQKMTKVMVSLPNHWLLGGESFWAEVLGQDRYRICNIPLCAYDLNLGDVVQALEVDEESKPEIQSVLERSGNRTLRVIMQSKAKTEAVVAELEALGLDGTGFAQSFEGYLAFNVPKAVDYEMICELLERWQAEGLLEHETCEARVKGSFDSAPES
jgi:hypothetical protein